MLIMREMQLNSLTGALSVNDSFAQKLLGNYELAQARFTPKDLLYLLAASPELPEDLGGMTTFAVENNITDRSELTMQVFSNVVNRILLSNTQDFTYQDQVYIDTVLQKLGITDVTEFMRQVKLLYEENTSIERLTALYQNNLTVLRTLAASEEGQAPAATPEPHAEQETVPQAGYYLHQDIYRRLQTAKIYNEVANFQHDQTNLQQTMRRQELQLAEQRRVSNFLQFTELKNQIRQGDALHLTYLQNQYETGELLPPPEDETQVVEQLTEASLFDAVGRVMVTAIANRLDSSAFYFDLRQVLTQTAENTLNRYQTYHSDTTQRFTENTTLAESRNALYREEIHLLDKLLGSVSGETGAQTVIRQGDVVDARRTLELTHLIEAGQAEEAEPIETITDEAPERPVRTSAELNQILTERLAEVTRTQAEKPLRRAAMPSLEEVVRTHTRERETASETRRVERERLTEALRQVVRAERELSAQNRTVSMQTVQDVRNLLQNEQISVDARAAVSNLLVNRPEYRTLLRIEQNAQALPPVETVHMTEQLGDVYESVLNSLTEQHPLSVEARTALTRLFRTKTETAAPGHTETLLDAARTEHVRTDTVQTEQTETVREGGVSEETTLRERFDTYSEHDRVMTERVQPAAEQQTAGAPELKPDSASTVQHVLRTLTGPENVLVETPVPAPAIEHLHTETERAEETETVHEHTVSEETTLRERLDAYNERNRIMAERLQQIMIEKAASTPQPKVDAAAARQNALRALTDPEGVLVEALTRTPPAELTHAKLPPVVEALLEQADEPTRKVYEAVLLGKPLEGAADVAGAMRKVQNLGAFNAEMAAREHEAAQMVHERTETEQTHERIVRETTQEVAQRLIEGSAGTVLTPQPPRQRTPVSLVHKQEQQFFTDELIEALNNRRETSRQDTVTHQELLSRQSQTVDINQINKRTVERTTEDVSELINRTLARQLGTLSDKVYNQMEKRLRLERARRGR